MSAWISKLQRRCYSCIVLIIFTITGVVPPSMAQSEVFMPPPGTMVLASTSHQLPVLQGVVVSPEDPFKFDFIVHPGDEDVVPDAFQSEAQKLIRYFLATLTTPEKDMWVNLSPYEGDRIIPDAFGQTDMGRDMLAQDYLLKQITATMLYPEEEIGRAFWDKVYQEAYQRYGTSEIPVDSFHKVWIMPDVAQVYENGDRAFITQSRLKVLLERDYIAEQGETSNVMRQTNGSSRMTYDPMTYDYDEDDLSSEIMRSVIIPELEREVNEGAHFAPLRQLYSSLILATWYKKKLRQSILAEVYVDQNKIKGIDIDDKDAKEKIYDQYVEAFKKGVFDYIKEEMDPLMQEMIPRRYFSGGVDARNFSDVAMTIDGQAQDVNLDRAMIVGALIDPVSDVDLREQGIIDDFYRGELPDEDRVAILWKRLEANEWSRNPSEEVRRQTALALIALGEEAGTWWRFKQLMPFMTPQNISGALEQELILGLNSDQVYGGELRDGFYSPAVEMARLNQLWRNGEMGVLVERMRKLVFLSRTDERVDPLLFTFLNGITENREALVGVVEELDKQIRQYPDPFFDSTRPQLSLMRGLIFRLRLAVDSNYSLREFYQEAPTRVEDLTSLLDVGTEEAWELIIEGYAARPNKESGKDDFVIAIREAGRQQQALAYIQQEYTPYKNRSTQFINNRIYRITSLDIPEAYDLAFKMLSEKTNHVGSREFFRAMVDLNDDVEFVVAYSSIRRLPEEQYVLAFREALSKRLSVEQWQVLRQILKSGPTLNIAAPYLPEIFPEIGRVGERLDVRDYAPDNKREDLSGYTFDVWTPVSAEQVPEDLLDNLYRIAQESGLTGKERMSRETIRKSLSGDGIRVLFIRDREDSVVAYSFSWVDTHYWASSLGMIVSDQSLGGIGLGTTMLNKVINDYRQMGRKYIGFKVAESTYPGLFYTTYVERRRHEGFSSTNGDGETIYFPEATVEQYLEDSKAVGDATRDSFKIDGAMMTGADEYDQVQPSAAISDEAMIAEAERQGLLHEAYLSQIDDDNKVTILWRRLEANQMNDSPSEELHQQVAAALAHLGQAAGNWGRFQKLVPFITPLNMSLDLEREIIQYLDEDLLGSHELQPGFYSPDVELARLNQLWRIAQESGDNYVISRRINFLVAISLKDARVESFLFSFLDSISDEKELLVGIVQKVWSNGASGATNESWILERAFMLRMRLHVDPDYSLRENYTRAPIEERDLKILLNVGTEEAWELIVEGYVARNVTQEGSKDPFVIAIREAGRQRQAFDAIRRGYTAYRNGSPQFITHNLYRIASLDTEYAYDFVLHMLDEETIHEGAFELFRAMVDLNDKLVYSRYKNPFNVTITEKYALQFRAALATRLTEAQRERLRHVVAKLPVLFIPEAFLPEIFPGLGRVGDVTETSSGLSLEVWTPRRQEESLEVIDRLAELMDASGLEASERMTWSDLEEEANSEFNRTILIRNAEGQIIAFSISSTPSREKPWESFGGIMVSDTSKPGLGRTMLNKSIDYYRTLGRKMFFFVAADSTGVKRYYSVYGKRIASKGYNLQMQRKQSEMDGKDFHHVDIYFPGVKPDEFPNIAQASRDRTDAASESDGAMIADTLQVVQKKWTVYQHYRRVMDFVDNWTGDFHNKYVVRQQIKSLSEQSLQILADIIEQYKDRGDVRVDADVIQPLVAEWLSKNSKQVFYFDSMGRDEELGQNGAHGDFYIRSGILSSLLNRFPKMNLFVGSDREYMYHFRPDEVTNANRWTNAARSSKLISTYHGVGFGFYQDEKDRWNDVLDGMDGTMFFTGSEYGIDWLRFLGMDIEIDFSSFDENVNYGYVSTQNMTRLLGIPLNLSNPDLYQNPVKLGARDYLAAQGIEPDKNKRARPLIIFEGLGGVNHDGKAKGFAMKTNAMIYMLKNVLRDTDGDVLVMRGLGFDSQIEEKINRAIEEIIGPEQRKRLHFMPEREIGEDYVVTNGKIIGDIVALSDVVLTREGGTVHSSIAMGIPVFSMYYKPILSGRSMRFWRPIIGEKLYRDFEIIDERTGSSLKGFDGMDFPQIQKMMKSFNRFLVDLGWKLTPGARIDDSVKEELLDAAMVTQTPEAIADVVEQDALGGIDFDANKFDLQVDNAGSVPDFRIDVEEIRNMKIQGFRPIILKISPVTNIPLVLGVEEGALSQSSG